MIENEKYLRSHPELSLIIKNFLKYVFLMSLLM